MAMLRPQQGCPPFSLIYPQVGAQGCAAAVPAHALMIIFHFSQYRESILDIENPL
jgi:hypothetical protein